jgi:hypothetical protein
MVLIYEGFIRCLNSIEDFLMLLMTCPMQDCTDGRKLLLSQGGLLPIIEADIIQTI